MATVTITHDFLAGTLAKASEVNQNFTDILNGVNGNLDQGNFTTMFNTIDWSIPGGDLAIKVSNSGNAGSIELTQNEPLGQDKSGIQMIHTAAEQALGAAGLSIDFTSVDSTVPLLRLKNNGSGRFLSMQDGSGVDKASINNAGEGSFNTVVVGNVGGSLLSNPNGAELRVSNKLTV